MFKEIHDVEMDQLKYLKKYSLKETWFYIKPENLTKLGAFRALVEPTNNQRNQIGGNNLDLWHGKCSEQKTKSDFEFQ